MSLLCVSDLFTEWHIPFRLATLTFKALRTGRTPYLSLHYHEPTEVSALIQFSSAFGPESQPIFWISCFLNFRSQSLEFITCQHLLISVTSYFQTSSKDILLSVSLPHFSCPRCLEYFCPCTLILLRLWHYINLLLTDSNALICYHAT